MKHRTVLNAEILQAGRGVRFAVERLAAIGSLAQLLARERKFVLLLQQLLQLGER